MIHAHYENEMQNKVNSQVSLLTSGVLLSPIASFPIPIPPPPPLFLLLILPFLFLPPLTCYFPGPFPYIQQVGLRSAVYSFSEVWSEVSHDWFWQENVLEAREKADTY